MGLRSLMWELASPKSLRGKGEGGGRQRGIHSTTGRRRRQRQSRPGLGRTNVRRTGKMGKRRRRRRESTLFCAPPPLREEKQIGKTFCPSVTLRISRHGKTNFLKIFLLFSLTRLQSLRAPRRPNPFAARPVPSSPRRGGSAVRPTQPVFT